MNQVTGEFQRIPEEISEEQAARAGYPIFQTGEVLNLRGGLFEVERITRNRLILKPVNRHEYLASLERSAARGEADSHVSPNPG